MLREEKVGISLQSEGIMSAMIAKRFKLWHVTWKQRDIRMPATPAVHELQGFSKTKLYFERSDQGHGDQKRILIEGLDVKFIQA